MVYGVRLGEIVYWRNLIIPLGSLKMGHAWYFSFTLFHFPLFVFVIYTSTLIKLQLQTKLLTFLVTYADKRDWVTVSGCKEFPHFVGFVRKMSSLIYAHGDQCHQHSK
uniref:Uncharacterized protein n=1 Tax=Cacopsylla melanoneura TaxID=428564 RepID=A0A8D9E7Y1_9HEMI